MRRVLCGNAKPTARITSLRRRYAVGIPPTDASPRRRSSPCLPAFSHRSTSRHAICSDRSPAPDIDMVCHAAFERRIAGAGVSVIVASKSSLSPHDARARGGRRNTSASSRRGRNCLTPPGPADLNNASKSSGLCAARRNASRTIQNNIEATTNVPESTAGAPVAGFMGSRSGARGTL